MTQFNDWISAVQTMKLPRYHDLPRIQYYSDQVVDFVNDALSPLFGVDQKPLTASMINNYVKQKMMPPPVKKRYSNDHVAFVITITILKQVVSIPSIVEGIRLVREEFGKEKAYDVFIDFIEEGVNNVIAQTHEINIVPIDNKPIVSTLIPMKASSMAFAAKLVAEKSLIDILNNEEEGKI